jgi:hypothetical protein
LWEDDFGSRRTLASPLADRQLPVVSAYTRAKDSFTAVRCHSVPVTNEAIQASRPAAGFFAHTASPAQESMFGEYRATALDAAFPQEKPHFAQPLSRPHPLKRLRYGSHTHSKVKWSGEFRTIALGVQTHQGPEGRLLNVSPAREGWVGFAPPRERQRRGTRFGGRGKIQCRRFGRVGTGLSSYTNPANHLAFRRPWGMFFISFPQKRLIFKQPLKSRALIQSIRAVSPETSRTP